MDRQTFLLQLDELLSLPAGTLKGPEKLETFEMWDSLATVNVIALANEHFDVTLSPRQIAGCTTVDELLALAPLHS
ncbi:MAG: acyl carrier protein [Acidobacteriia bacterium]|nr:acyl carrier protein [Terriglobia bacterium]